LAPICGAVFAFPRIRFGAAALLEIVNHERVETTNQQGKSENNAYGSTGDGLIVHPPAGRPAIPPEDCGHQLIVSKLP
jgi:hypothetical protein